MPANKRVIWLGATLVVAFIALVVVRSTDGPATVAGGASPAPAAGRPGPGPATAGPSTRVRLDALTRPRGEPLEDGRNPFVFRPTAPPAPPPSLRPAPVDTPVPQPAVPSGPPPPPPIPLKFIGLVEKADGTRIAVLSDGRRPIPGVEGQEVDGRYRILKIGNESIEIAYLDGRGRQTIRLTGQ